MPLQTTFLHEAAFGLFKAETKTTLEVRQAGLTRDFDAVRAEWCVAALTACAPA